MTHNTEISRSKPTAFLFVIDQSGSMGDKMPSEKTKADYVADVLNRTLATLITRCTKAEGTRDYFEIGVLGYGGDGVYNGFQNSLGSLILNKISNLEANPLRVEDRKQKMDDGAGGIVEQPIKFPVWFEPRSSGGTPMCAALIKAAEELVTWCDSHQDSYPPTVLHISDGESTDGNPEELASKLCQIQTSDGPVLMYNLHVSSSIAAPIKFPSSELQLPDDFSKMLFNMSSHFPDHILSYASEKGYQVGNESRMFMFNAEPLETVDFFDIGTRSTQLR
jgi:hypothetical protein